MVLDPAGPAAARIEQLWWLLFVVGTIVGIAVLALVTYAIFHRARDASDRLEQDRRGTRWIVMGGIVVPAIILVPIFGITLVVMHHLTVGNAPADLVVEITGKRWWWEIRYLSSQAGPGFTTANELHIPAGRRVELRLTSDDVIHSFWVPALQGKTDLVPGRRTSTWIQADRPGIYSGPCAEFCGLQHARMTLLVVAMPAADFEGWSNAQREPAAAPLDSTARAGMAAFTGSGCAVCHTVRGTGAAGATGPDLTHVASRLTLAAGVLPNTPGHLAGWVTNPQSVKPGALMPNVAVGARELAALLRYLALLR